MRTFEDKLIYGNKIQEKIIGFLTKYWNMDFVAGDRNGKTINPEIIESLFGCEYIPIIKNKHGALLSFIDLQTEEPITFTMPDELFVNRKSGKYFWVESKSDRDLSETLSKIKQYAEVSGRTKTGLFIIFAVSINYGGEYDLYSCSAEEKYYTVKTDDNGTDRVYFDKSKMTKLNKYPV